VSTVELLLRLCGDEMALDTTSATPAVSIRRLTVPTARCLNYSLKRYDRPSLSAHPPHHYDGTFGIAQ